ncbi:MAG: hypothetical protein JWO70_3618 [Betaproteobacteria bacterium]|nr:hypothetical protein [Betaproteobacteria bacterium]
MIKDPSLPSYPARLGNDTPAGRIPRDVMHPAKRSFLDGESSGRTARDGLSKPNAETIVDLVFDLEKAKSVRRLTRLLAVPSTSRAAKTRSGS